MKFALLHAYFHYRMGGTIYRNGGSVPTESRYHRAGQAVQLGPEYSNKLNVLNIISSKGLEFKEVIVFNYDLTDNELYIACSRALEKLIVIEDT